jgi:DNA-nicking Smr family endonuclease
MATPLMKKKLEISEEERDLFQQAMRGVKKIVSPKKINPPPPPVVRRKKTTATTSDTGFEFSDFEKVDAVGGNEMITYNRNGLQDKKLRKLRSGQYNVEATLDLHGLTAAEAKESLNHFLRRCQQSGVRHVLIIHGKGRSDTQPVLKNKLNNWLRQTNQIVAFCSAAAKDGHSGAMYVLLKNQHREKPV